ncbi:cysteine desulfurase family protein [Ammoniphilus sp. CFH 90114]|uniref:cysteine desulfurase family protein n=1 Tax=Ammoniphilus sp. CFH 90114 TaxID=2493665 RepID=UPI00100E87AF|nr:cysteine desulfurase family protein [Ammoniphilus sp. CFH 90114]RXT15285.1 cysteine desulfurase [Ammoniphilus sp. CFH 90114]
MDRVYLDYNASTPIDERVTEAMRPYWMEHYGNPSTTHWAATPAKQAVEKARTQIANLLQCDPAEVIFTSGGSEANNHALKGVFYALQHKGKHIITSAIEHPAIIQPCKFLERLGAEVTYVGVDEYGRVSPEEIEAAITDKTILISVMHANNEVGTLQPIAQIAEIAKKYGVLLHSDAAQSVGKVPTRVNELGVDLLSIAGHKLYAPKGVGALYIRKGTPIETFIHGAGHEDGRRAGTENVILAVGLGKACELAGEELEHSKVEELRDYFWHRLQEEFGPAIRLNGHLLERLPNTLNVSFMGRLGSDILTFIPGLAASTGSACHSGKVQLSSVLQAMGTTEEEGQGTIRFSLGRYTTKEELEQAIGWLVGTIN